jgi:hypothetical protein
MKKIIVVLVFLFAVVVTNAFGQAKIYIAGAYSEGDVRRACYWENGTRIDLPIPAGAKESSTSSIEIKE